MRRIFATVNTVKKSRLTYKVKGQTVTLPQGEFFNICAPLPKNRKQMERLYNILIPYSGRLLLPHSLKHIAELKQLSISSLHFENRVLISAFMEYCRKNLPEKVLVYGKNYLTPQFFGRLSKYAGQIILPADEYDPYLCKQVLNLSGAPLLFDKKAENVSAVLMLENQHFPFNASSCPIFEKDIFKKIAVPENGLKLKEFENFDPLESAAAMFFHWRCKKTLDFWKMLVIKENMIYNID